MKRDMGIVRRIALAAADMKFGEELRGLDGVPTEEFVMHVIWMVEAGLIEGAAQAGMGSMARYAVVTRLTWSGCEFADAVADESVWKKACGTVIKPGASFTFDVLRTWLKSEILQGLPTFR